VSFATSQIRALADERFAPYDDAAESCQISLFVKAFGGRRELSLDSRFGAAGFGFNRFVARTGAREAAEGV
jgi:hypothetical protein